MFDRIDGEKREDVLAPTAGKDKLRNLLADAVVNTGGKKRENEDRRFTDKPQLDPGSVRSLPLNHAALTENRTLFPSTVVSVDEDFSDRLLVSGKNNRKLGERISKGKFKGYALYGLSLEERATCPTSCSARAYCYGNGMQMARRHKITDLGLFELFLQDEIRTILADPIDGLMVRLHVLGDFPSVEYVALWSDLLAEHKRLACYGYTHRLPRTKGGDEIGDAISALKVKYPDRFRIRWSSDVPMPDGAVVIDRAPAGKRVREGLICPAQTDDTACCASCGLCWEGGTRNDTIVFVKHGPKSLDAAAASVSAPASEGVRPIAGMTIPQKRDAVLSKPPEVRLVSPTDLRVEAAYQRDLSGKSMALIRKIVIGWDWVKFKPPVCAETADGLVVIDGQHTAMAAASHPEIKQIPVMVHAAGAIERRADAFVAHNRDRLNMSPFQIFHAEVAAGNKEAMAILAIAGKAGASIPRYVPPKAYAKPGQVIALGEVRRIHAVDGADALERILRIAVGAGLAPVAQTVTRALRMLCKEPAFTKIAKMPDAKITAAIRSIKNIDHAARTFALSSEQGRDRACAVLISNALGGV
jgi:hypothetical protein